MVLRCFSVLAAFGMLAVIPNPAAAWCNMDGFNLSDPPSPISDIIDGYSDLHLEWGSDVDPFGDGERSWHYVRNLHEQAVSVEWPQAGLIIPFQNALPQGKVHCVKNYIQTKGAFVRDDNAPMQINSYADSPAVAYVRDPAAASELAVSTVIETGFSHKGVEIEAVVDVSFYHKPGSAFAEMVVTYDPPNMGVIFSNKTLKFGTQTIMNLAGGSEYQTGKLHSLMDTTSISGEGIKYILNDQSFMVRGKGEGNARIDISGYSPANIPLVLVDPNGSMIASGEVHFDGWSKFPKKQ